MARKIRPAKLNTSATRVSRRSHTVKHAKLKLTIAMLVVLVVLLGAYELVTHLRTDLSRGGMEVVVGSNLMACIDPADIPGETPLLDALEEVAVRPASRQVLVLTGPELNMELTAAQAQELALYAEKGSVAVRSGGEALGCVQRVYLPTDEESVQPLP
ncbi:MAG: hypothetical protein SPE01_01495 [Candidatus Spyradocola sp.]|nr:hypothetical protein [Candidatus Spyradocola sp.]